MEPIEELFVDIFGRPQNHAVVDPVWSDARPAGDARVVNFLIEDEAKSEIVPPDSQPAKMMRTDEIDRALNGIEPNWPESTQRRDKTAVDAVHLGILATKVRLDGAHPAGVPLSAPGKLAAASWALPHAGYHTSASGLGLDWYRHLHSSELRNEFGENVSSPRDFGGIIV